MLYYILVPILVGVVAFSCDFFCTLKSRSGKPPRTDASRVAELYGEIKKMKTLRYRKTKEPPTLLDDVKLHLHTGIETAKTLMYYGLEELMISVYTPMKLATGSHLLVLPYYSAGIWYNALISHVNTSSRVLRVTARVDDVDGIDVTDRIKTYMGPSEDFYGQHGVTVEGLGYDRLCFVIMEGGNIVPRVFDGDVDIGLALRSKSSNTPLSVGANSSAEALEHKFEGSLVNAESQT